MRAIQALLKRRIREALKILSRLLGPSTEPNQPPKPSESSDQMTKLIIIRSYQPKQTLSRWIVVKGVINKPAFQCVGLELPYKGNERNISCIPEGVYPTEKIDSPNFGDAFAIEGVPNRDLIRIHAGNYTHQTRGCPLPGYQFVKMDNDNLWDVNFSRQTIAQLYEHLPDKFKTHIISL